MDLFHAFLSPLSGCVTAPGCPRHLGSFSPLPGDAFRCKPELISFQCVFTVQLVGRASISFHLSPQGVLVPGRRSLSRFSSAISPFVVRSPPSRAWRFRSLGVTSSFFFLLYLADYPPASTSSLRFRVWSAARPDFPGVLAFSLSHAAFGP